MRKTYQITEYGSFISGKQVDGYSTLPEKTFEQLENFVLSNRNKETDALELLSLSAKKGLGKVITAKNYVGIISMNDGTTIEKKATLFFSFGCVNIVLVLFDILFSSTGKGTELLHSSFWIKCSVGIGITSSS